jgi:hypothetical protein
MDRILSNGPYFWDIGIYMLFGQPYLPTTAYLEH